MEHPLLAQPTPAGHTWRPTLLLVLVFSYFVLFGCIIGAEGVLWADIMLALDLSKITFGTVQLSSPLASVGVMLIGGQLCAWAGNKRLALAGIMVLALSKLGLAASGSLWSVVGVLLLAGMGNALLETAMNATTMDWEQATGRSMMNIMHAGFSGGAVLGAFGAGALLGQGWSYGQVLLGIVALCGLVFLATLPVRYPPAHSDETSRQPTTALSLLRRPGLLLLALLCLLGIVAESVAFVWSVIYMRELGAQIFVGGVAFALFNGAMFSGRLANASLVARLGIHTSLLVSGGGLMLGTLLLMLPGSIPLAIVAFMLIGLAVAGLVPTTLGAAARLVPGNSGAVTAALMTVAYSGFIFSPPLVGWVAEISSLRVALLVIGLCGLAILWLARRVDTYLPEV